MTDKQSNPSFRERIGLLGFGYKLVSKLTPVYLPLMLLRALCIAAQPMIVLFFSARILNVLDDARDVYIIILFASITVGATFLLSVLKGFLTREVDTISDWWLVYQKTRMLQAERFAKIDYAYTEDSMVSEALARMDTQAKGNGLGLIKLYQHSTQIAENLFSLIFSWILLGGPLAEKIRLDVAWPTTVLYGVFVLGVIIVLLLQSRSQLILTRLFDENAKINNAADYYKDYLMEDQAAKDIRLYGQSDALLAILKRSFSLRVWLKFFFFDGRVNGIMLGLLAVLSGGYYLIAGYGALGGVVTVGGIVQSVGAVTVFATAIGTLIGMLGQLFNNARYLKPMKSYLSLPDLLVKGRKPVPPTEGHCYKFEFQSVSFCYPNTEEYVLKDLSLTFNAGQRLAVVGLNGSGKTTMIKLLCRLYEPTEGEILLDGVNIKEYDYTEYTALFSVVFQDFYLFPFELGANVAVREEYDKNQVTPCLDRASFTERMKSMPDGLNTTLYKVFDEDGTQISRGEAQKIALARALYKDAPFIILDEPTAALDPIAEYEVYTTINQTLGGKTAVFISHRLSSCRFCHDIVVFDQGKIVQRGGHDELLADTRGLYIKMWDAQAQHYTG